MNIYTYKFILFIYLITIIYTHIACKNKDFDVQVKTGLLTNPLDSILLKTNTGELTRFEYYDQKSDIYLTQSVSSPITFYFHDNTGKEIGKIITSEEGPESINSIIDAVIDSNQLIVITIDQVIYFDINSEQEINRIKLYDNFTLLRGGSKGRKLLFKDYIIVSLLTTNEVNIGIGSREFLNNAGIIKIYDKKDFSLLKKIKLPKESIYQKGLFQPTLYEPDMCIDFKNKELEVVFPIDPNLYTWSLDNFDFIAKKPFKNKKDYQLPEPVDFDKRNKLEPKFTSDHQQNNSFFEIFNFNGNTVVCHLPSNDERINLKLSTEYNIYDNQGQHLISYPIKISRDHFISILGKKTENQYFGLININKLAKEPKGYPLYLFDINF